ncbi:RNA annealing protein [Mycena indigotica]|uniref:RNA annealing protein n=1 Tax=Mycena indigotica TaxID=2126181 RepID=A0A8H6TCE6_9AGAR|nr:RNA annealing protein [Mycena indigotica]KAF7316235.1 RNA annealing protein [Mycena indigotica]
MSRTQRSYHGPKRHITGNNIHVAPAWKSANTMNSANAPNGGRVQLAAEPGSKILIGSLPNDVKEPEIEDLFKRTIGPVRELFVIYNSQGLSKGMAVVSFQRPGDARKAQERFSGSMIDGRRPIRIQIIVDEAAPEATATPTRTPTLFDRLQSQPVAGPSRGPQALRFSVPAPIRHVPHVPPRPATPYNAANNHIVFPPAVPVGAGLRRIKKGPKRLKKQWAAAAAVAAAATPGQPFVLGRARKSKTREELDREMEDYRAEGAQIED